MTARNTLWMKVVGFTRRSPLFMAGFAAVAVGVPYFVGDQVMGTTNSPQADSKLEAELRARGGIDAQMLAKAQKERLQVLLDEVRTKSGGDDRYKAALDGRSLGTHSSGTSADAVAIKK